MDSFQEEYRENYKPHLIVRENNYDVFTLLEHAADDVFGRVVNISLYVKYFADDELNSDHFPELGAGYFFLGENDILYIKKDSFNFEIYTLGTPLPKSKHEILQEQEPGSLEGAVHVAYNSFAPLFRIKETPPNEELRWLLLRPSETHLPNISDYTSILIPGGVLFTGLRNYFRK